MTGSVNTFMTGDSLPLGVDWTYFITQ
jgi:hypothetical protein